jgi:replicative DNA helicase
VNDLLTNPEMAERSVVSAMMQNPEAVWNVLEVMPVTSFIHPKHEMIATAIVTLAEMNAPTDPVAVIAELERTATLSKVGGPDYVVELFHYAPTWHNAGYYAQIVRFEAVRVQLRKAAASIGQLSQVTEGTELELIEAARSTLDTAVGVPMADEIDPRVELMEMVENIGQAVPAHPTPWPRLSSIIKGFRPGGLYVIAARPGVGKSALALQCATELEHFGYVGFFSLEMGRTEILHRQLSQVTELPLSLIEGDSRLPEWAAARARDFAATHPAHMVIDDRGSLSIGDIRQKVRTWTRQYELSAIVVDYLQLMNGTGGEQNRLQAVTETSRGLKILARDLGVPVIALSQLNRNAESRIDKMPALSDLRESGAIEQDADVVMLLHRDMGFSEDVMSDNMQVLIAKNRQGPTGRVELLWQGDYVRALS